MPRTRRKILPNHVYEVCLKTKMGLPFVARNLIRVIIEGCLARTQRDHKVKMCHAIWMANHLHLMLVALDSGQCIKFYSELMKKITDSFKKLFDLDELALWERRPSVIEILDIEKAIERISYFYANPARAHLVESIGQFPGISTWTPFTNALPVIDAKVSKTVKWARQIHISSLSNKSLDYRHDEEVASELETISNIEHELTYEPNAWLECFGIQEPDRIFEINEWIIDNVRSIEQSLRHQRHVEKRSVLGVHQLRIESIFKAHTPSKKSRRLIYLTSQRQLAIEYLDDFKLFEEQCEDCFEGWKLGDFSVRWPQGAFRPWLVPVRVAEVE